MKTRWIFLYVLLILTFPCFAFAASGDASGGSSSGSAGANSSSGPTDITGAKAAETMSPYAEGEIFRVSPDPYLPGAYRITPVKPSDTGAASAQARPEAAAPAGGKGISGLYRITPDPQVWGAYLATPERPVSGDTGSQSGSGAAPPPSAGSTRAD